MKLPVITLDDRLKKLMRENPAISNPATINPATNNLATNNYVTYKYAIDRNRVTQKFIKPTYNNSLTDELNRRKEYMFDYDNQNQVNSFADVIMRTFKGMGESVQGIQPWMTTLQDTASDTWSLLYKGIVEPIRYKDPEVLLQNQLVNFSETVDLVDNIWKAFDISGGFKDIDAGMAGVKQAIFERKNFDYDTGNKVWDLAREILTPTNIFLWVATGGVGVAGRAAAKEVGEEVSSKVMKSFARNYTGDVQKTFSKMGMNLTQANMDSLTNIAKHATNMKVIAGVNKIKRGVDVIDSIGPRVAIAGTIGVPWKIIKATSNATGYATRYMANVVDAVQAGNVKSVVSVLAARPEYEYVINNTAEAFKLAGEKEVLIGFDTIMSGPANQEAKSLRKLVKEYKTSFNSKQLINQYTDNVFKETGFVPPYEAAQAAVKDKSVLEFTLALDNFAKESSAGLYNTFEDYASMVTTLNEITDIGDSIKGLYQIVKQVEAEKQVADLNTMYKQAYDVVLEVSKKRQLVTGVEDRLARMREVEVIKLTDEYEDLLVKNRPEYKARLEYELQVLKDRSDALSVVIQKSTLTSDPAKEIAELMKKKTKFQKLAKAGGYEYNATHINSQIQALQTQLDGSANIPVLKAELTKVNTAGQQLYEQIRDLVNIPQRLTNLDAKIKDFPLDEMPNAQVFKISIDREVELLQQLLDDLTQEGLVPRSEYHNNMITTFANYITDAIAQLKYGAAMSNLELTSLKNISDYGVDFKNSVTDILQGLIDLPNKIVANNNVADNLNKLSKLYYSDDMINFADDMVNTLTTKLKDSKKPLFSRKVASTFTPGGVIKATEYESFLTKIDNLIKSFDEDMIEGLGTARGNAVTLEYMSEEAANTLARMRGDLELLKIKYNAGEIDSALIERIYEDMVGVKHSVTRAMDSIQRQAEKSVNQTKLYIDDYAKVLDSIEEIENTLGLTADIVVEYSKDALKTYTPKLNATFRNLHILKNEDIENLLDALADKDYTSIPALETLQYISFYDTSALSGLKYALSSGNVVEVAEAYKLAMGEDWNPTQVSRTKLLEAVNTIIEVKESAEVVMDTLQGMLSVRQLYGSIMTAVDDGMDKNVAGHLLDAIQRVYNKPATLVSLDDELQSANALKGAIQDIVNNVENQLRNDGFKYNVRASSWRDRVIEMHRAGELPEEALDDFESLFGKSNMTHTAVADAYSEFLIHKHILKDVDVPGVKHVYIDIESNGLNVDTGIVYQKSVVIPEADIYKWYINTDVNPKYAPADDDLYYILFGDDQRVNSLDYLKDLYKRIYEQGDIDALKKHFKITDKRIDIIPINGDAELLAQSMDFIKSQKPPAGSLQYRVYNGLEYDVPLLNNRARFLGVDGYNIDKNTIEDTKLMLEDMLKLRRLSMDEKITIENIIKDYIFLRKGETSSVGLKRGMGGVARASTRNLGKFLPTLDQTFTVAYERLVNAFDPLSKESKLIKEFNAYTESRELFKELSNAMGSVHDSLRDLHTLDAKLQGLNIAVHAEDIKAGHRLLPDDWAKDIPDGVKANNVSIDMMQLNNVNGVYVPITGVRKGVDPNLVNTYFAPKGMVTDTMMSKMTTIAGNIQKTMMYVRNPMVLETMSVTDLQVMHYALLEQLQKIAGNNYFSPVLSSLKVSDNVLGGFATVYELMKTYNNVARASKFEIVQVRPGVFRYAGLQDMLEKLAIKFGDEDHTLEALLDTLTNPKELFKKMLNEFGEEQKFHTLEPTPGDMEKIFNYYRHGSDISLSTLEQLNTAQDALEFTRLKRTIPIYRNMTDSFGTFQQVATDVHAFMEKELGLKSLEDFSEAGVLNNLRTIIESYDAVLAYRKLEQVLSYSPEDMAAYLRHHAKGIIGFKHDSLFSATYFPIRNNLSMADVLETNMGALYKAMLDNRKAYESLGISFKVTRDNTLIYIRESDINKFANIKYKPLTQDFNMEEWLEKLIDAGLRSGGDMAEYMEAGARDTIVKGMQELNKARGHLVGLATDASTSTLELLDDISMEKLMLGLNNQVPDMLSLDTMRHHAFFEGNYFNHSILGHIDGRRTFMPYSAFNPAKTMFHAAHMLEGKLGVQVQFIQYMQVPEFMVKNVLQATKNPEDVIEYLKKAPHLKVAFLNGNKAGTDFKLSAITINTIKDLEFAKSVNAVIVDRETYNTAYSVINNYRVKDGILRFLDRVLVAPFKIGWLAYNYAVVVRNILDTSIKNLTTTKDVGMVLTMAEMTKDYYNFKNTLTDIYRYAQKQNIKIDVAVDEFFAKGNVRGIDRETFDMITEYQKAGGSMGLVREAQAYYGESMDRMYRKAGEELSGVSKNEFRELFKMPDDVAEQWLKERFPAEPHRTVALMDLKSDLLTYKRAYAMHNKYKGQDITVEQFVVYLKSGRVPEEHRQIFNDMLEATRSVRVEEDMLEQIMGSPLVANALSWNMQSEEILRLSLFKYMKKHGYSTPETMAEITRTHFNYDHKTQAQLYLEMAMPFSTFKTMSIAYWAEEMSNSPMITEVFSDTWSAVSQFKERELEDILLRRSLRYQMYTGNIILNEDTGFTAKINPSAVDMMQFFANPVQYVQESFHSGGQAAWQLLSNEPYDWEDEEAFRLRKQTLMWNMIPFLGTHVNRIRSNKNESLLLGLLLAPMFNTTWTPEQSKYNKFVPFKDKPYMPSRSYFRDNYTPAYNKNYKRQYKRRYYPKYFKKSYPIKGYKDWSLYSTFNRAYFGSYMKFRRGSVYPTKNYRSLNTSFSDIWRLSMTKKGNPKYRFLGFPTNKWTLQLKVNILRNLASYNRWQ